MLTETRRQRVYASYHQFYIVDSSPFRYAKPGKFPGDPGEAALWNRQEFEDRLAAIPGMLAVSTGSYGYVRVETEIHTSEPELQLDQWDHVTEGPLEMKSQDLMIIGCIDNGGEVLAVTPGFYRVRCCHANLAGARDSNEGADWYLVQIWPAPSAPVQVLKRAERPGPKVSAAPAKPQVSIQASAGGEAHVTFDGNGLEAHGITLRRLIAIVYGSSTEREFPMDLIIGPPILDAGFYNASATGQGWVSELRRTLAEQFRWRFQFVMRGNGPTGRHYLAISDADAEAEAERQRNENLRRHAR
jgi:hypothetical protein